MTQPASPFDLTGQLAVVTGCRRGAIPVKRVVISAYVLSGLAAGLRAAPGPWSPPVWFWERSLAVSAADPRLALR